MSKAALTRIHILQKAFDLIYRQGFQATSIDEIIATTELTKGAFFYHFKNKDEMGLAMIRELLAPAMQIALIEPLQKAEDPLDAIYEMMESILLKDSFFLSSYGCPAVNLIDEMSPVNESFRLALLEIMMAGKEAMEATIQRGMDQGRIRKDVKPSQVSAFVLIGYSGVRNMGKLVGAACYPIYLRELRTYLQNLA